ncbi:MAG: pantetheine-phosphate adenylyltransferase [Clostridia bacterium]|nr:pantetheine-phosphate adenylyltransferase [Clostridia bacterium]
MKKCVFAGSFDPPTTGHKKIIDDCLKLFDEVVVAIMINTQKTCALTEQQRKALIEKLYKDNGRVRVVIFGGAAVDLLEKENTPFYVRGVRNTVDFEYENQNFFANKKLKDDIVTIYIPAEQQSLHVSSTLVKNSVKFDKDFKDYVPEEIYGDIIKLLSPRK